MANNQLELEQEEAAPEMLPLQPLSSSGQRKQQNKGIAWVLTSFIFCPCHLPITLGILAAIFGGTALGAFFIRYSILAGTIITLIWLAGTWYSFRLLRAKSTTACSIR